MTLWRLRGCGCAEGVKKKKSAGVALVSMAYMFAYSISGLPPRPAALSLRDSRGCVVPIALCRRSRSRSWGLRKAVVADSPRRIFRRSRVNSVGVSRSQHSPRKSRTSRPPVSARVAGDACHNHHIYTQAGQAHISDKRPPCFATLWGGVPQSETRAGLVIWALECARPRNTHQGGGNAQYRHWPTLLASLATAERPLLD